VRTLLTYWLYEILREFYCVMPMVDNCKSAGLSTFTPLPSMLLNWTWGTRERLTLMVAIIMYRACSQIRLFWGTAKKRVNTLQITTLKEFKLTCENIEILLLGRRFKARLLQFNMWNNTLQTYLRLANCKKVSMHLTLPWIRAWLAFANGGVFWYMDLLVSERTPPVVWW
jgi:hypothetical protein